VKIVSKSLLVFMLLLGAGCAQTVENTPQQTTTEQGMKEIRVKVNQIELQVRDYPHAGEAIVFLHGGGENLMVWERIIPAFKDHYRLIMIDFRGHGQSDITKTGYHIDQLADDVVGVMKALKLDKAHIVGSSTGAEVALSMGANFPEMVSSVVLEGALISPYGPYSLYKGSETEFSEHVAGILKRTRTTPDKVFPSIDALVEDNQALYKKHDVTWNQFTEAVIRYDAHKLGEGKFASSMRKEQWDNYLSFYYQYRFEDYFKKLKCPILMIGGKDEFESELAQATQNRLMALSEQGGELVVLDEWMHAQGWLQTPDDASKTILRFLGGLAQ
jgi:pimeloyl-ACP methyl ester carboxylesterase